MATESDAWNGTRPASRKSTLLRSALYYLLTGMGVAGLAFVSQYPLVYSDSGAYIENSFDLFQYDDRPIGYGLIMRAVSWEESLWAMVLFQGVLASWLLMLLVRESVSRPERRTGVHLVLLAVLVLGSSLPWYAAQIMADHFTPLVLIILFLLLQAKRLGPWREGALWILLFFSVSTHNAHVPMVILLCGAMALLMLPRKVAPVGKRFWWRLAAVNGVTLSAALMIMLFNLSDHGRMTLSTARNTFLAGRLCEDGIMADYLAETCPEKDNVLCPCQGNLPLDAGEMLWSDKGLPNIKHITLGEADELLAPVVGDLLSRPAYLARYLRSACVSTMVQLFQWDAGAGLDRYGEGTSPHYAIRHRFPREMQAYGHNRQQWDYWVDRNDTNRRIAFVLVLSLVVIFRELFRTGGGEGSLSRRFACWVAIWVFLNAAITSSLSVVDPRLQSRVMWLLTLAAFLVVCEQPSVRGFIRGFLPNSPEPRA